MEKTIDVQEPSQVTVVRRMVADEGALLGMSDSDLSRATLVATEASTNLVKYGKQGRVTVRPFHERGSSGIELIVVDQGPGIADFRTSSRDGFSTSGSLGIGLGAIIRTCDTFDVYTTEDAGTALLCRVAKGSTVEAAVPGALMLGGRSTPKPGQFACGDAWAYVRAGRWERLCVVDGLGHGPLAASAAQAAVAVFMAAGEAPEPSEILAAAHVALRSTRGVVMGILAVDTQAGTALFAGVGNIAGVLHTRGETHHLLCIEGVVGYNMRPPRNREFVWSRDSVAVMATDGLSTHWNLARYPGLTACHPALIASVLYRDFARDTDDATVAVAKETP